jgi:uncharacterized protein (TIGR03118 family)
VLEDRTVPSGYQQINLVGYQPGLGHFTDTNLNGWGMTSLPDGTFCVADAFTTGVATFYDRSGHVLPQAISVPASSAHAFGLTGHPTGVVYNPTSDFEITEGDRSAPARLIFDTLDGAIFGWNPCVDPTHAVKIADNSTSGALYTGLEIAQIGNQTVLYAADFGLNRVEMFTGTNGSFTNIGMIQDLSVKKFADNTYSTWSVQAVGDKLYVNFASLADLGGGVVDVCDTDGSNMVRFAANEAGTGPNQGPLQNPWGITQAPANFGAYSNDLLIGNVAGCGNINVFDPVTHAYLGQLQQPNGAPIAIRGLWDLEFGDGTPHGGKTNQLFFDAGPNHPGDATDGLFGVIHAAGDQGGNSDGGLPNALTIGVLGQGSGAALGGKQAQPVTSPSQAPAAGTPSAGAAGSNQRGTVTIQESTLSGNSAGSAGGGLYNGACGTVVLKDSGASGNVAPSGADVYNLGALTLADSTVGVIGP